MKCNETGPLVLLQYNAGDLTKEQQAAIKLHCEVCATCSEKLKNLQEEREQFLLEYPVPSGLKLPGKTSRLVFPHRIWSLAATFIVMVGAASLLVDRTPSENRIKGDVAIELFVSDNGGKPTSRPSGIFYPEERIQFTYSCAEERYLILFGIDTTGKTTVYYPAHGDSSIGIECGRGIPLPNSIVLDDYIGKECFVAVFSKKALEVQPIVARVVTGYRQCIENTPATLTVDDGIVRSVRIIKKERL